MGPVRLGVGSQWLLDGRTFRIVRQLADGHYVAQDVKFNVEQQYSEAEILSLYAQGRLRFATDASSKKGRRPSAPQPACEDRMDTLRDCP